MCYDGDIRVGFETTGYCDRMQIRGFEVGTHEKDIFFLLSVAILTAIYRTAFAADNPQPIHAGTRILHSGNLIVEVGDPDSPDCRWNQGLRFSARRI
ncbi:MAG: hypothetical protein HQ580_19520 [Planctomycetes bacterium]|nr:hypothetical protein [Planctomycetota bacterium]